MVEVLLYEGYLKRMRITGEANLNLDCEDLHAFPPSRKLYGQLVKYPQEVLPTRHHNRCDFADGQVIRLQETPNAVPDGQTPHTISLSAYDELVDASKPGDRLVVTGIFHSVLVRVNPRRRTIKSLFKTFLDVVHVKLGGDDSRLAFDKSMRPAGGDCLPGIGGGVG
ncbi:hypothetical protein BGW80DRAFT_1254449 [Lactifluus volemus]|nr:hypothetical protein BGW80DRAFT_1254449 [Lactifluus volemus]